MVIILKSSRKLLWFIIIYHCKSGHLSDITIQDSMHTEYTLIFRNIAALFVFLNRFIVAECICMMRFIKAEVCHFCATKFNCKNNEQCFQTGFLFDLFSVFLLLSETLLVDVSGCFESITNSLCFQMNKPTNDLLIIVAAH